ncbi:MAG: hypothetical protein GSR80_000252 [Desulfurococcales archaeon]|nr:hypothetical protein [Desulfurococcales archaeon]
MRLCIHELDRYLEKSPRRSGVAVLAGPLLAYPEVVALDIAKRCLLSEPDLRLLYVMILDDPAYIYDVARGMGLDLAFQERAGRAQVVSSSSLEEALGASLSAGDRTLIIVDATSGLGGDFRIEGLAEVFASARQRKDFLLLLVVNPQTVPEHIISVMAEMADLYMRLHSEETTMGLERSLSVLYYKGGLIPFLKLHYSIGPEGVSYSLRLEV